MVQHETSDSTVKTYEITLILEECTDGKCKKVIFCEKLGYFASEKVAREVIELVELPDLDHIIVI